MNETVGYCKNIIYLFDLITGKLLKRIKFYKIKSKYKIILITICSLTCDFCVITSNSCTLFNINGVILGDLDLINFNKISKITQGIIQ